MMNKYKFAVEYVGHEEVTIVATDLPAAEKMVESLHFKVLDKTLIDVEEQCPHHPDCGCSESGQLCQRSDFDAEEHY